MEDPKNRKERKEDLISDRILGQKSILDSSSDSKVLKGETSLFSKIHFQVV